MNLRLAAALAQLLLLLLMGVSDSSRGAEVGFVIADTLDAEGGSWVRENSPLQNPFGVDFDSKGNLCVVELGGGRVHRIDEDGEVTRIAGDGSKPYRGDGGPAIEATFDGMHNCAITADDHLLIADNWNHCVRQIDFSSGKINTIIGTGEEGFSGDGGPARKATFNFIICISLDDAKHVLHITDLKNRRIRNVDLKSGIVKTVAGSGKKGVPEEGADATQGPLVDPRAAASDSLGNLYILE